MSPETDEAKNTDELMVNVKRFVSDRRHRTELDDLLVAEANTFIEALSSHELVPNIPWSPAELTKRVALYEHVTERLGRTLGILGRWGDDSELTDVINIIMWMQRTLTEQKSGLTVWLNISVYPIVLLVASYGIALARSERWSMVHRMLSTQISMENRDPARLVDEFNLSSWKANDNSIWSNLDGLEKRKTPLSDHACRILSDWSTNYRGIIPSFEQLFDMWDILASLVFIEPAFTNETLTTSQTSRTWIPIGRVGWRAQSRLQTLHRIQHEFSDRLLQAGFFNRNRDALNQAILEIAAAADRFMW